MIEDGSDMSELLNKMFQQVFTKESQPDEPQDDKINVQIYEVIVNNKCIN